MDIFESLCGGFIRVLRRREAVHPRRQRNRRRNVNQRNTQPRNNNSANGNQERRTENETPEVEKDILDAIANDSDESIPDYEMRDSTMSLEIDDENVSLVIVGVFVILDQVRMLSSDPSIEERSNFKDSNETTATDDLSSIYDDFTGGDQFTDTDSMVSNFKPLPRVEKDDKVYIEQNDEELGDEFIHHFRNHKGFKMANLNVSIENFSFQRDVKKIVVTLLPQKRNFVSDGIGEKKDRYYADDFLDAFRSFYNENITSLPFLFSFVTSIYLSESVFDKITPKLILHLTENAEKEITDLVDHNLKHFTEVIDVSFSNNILVGKRTFLCEDVGFKFIFRRKFDKRMFLFDKEKSKKVYEVLNQRIHVPLNKKMKKFDYDDDDDEETEGEEDEDGNIVEKKCTIWEHWNNIMWKFFFRFEQEHLDKNEEFCNRCSFLTVPSRRKVVEDLFREKFFEEDYLLIFMVKVWEETLKRELPTYNKMMDSLYQTMDRQQPHNVRKLL